MWQDCSGCWFAFGSAGESVDDWLACVLTSRDPNRELAFYNSCCTSLYQFISGQIFATWTYTGSGLTVTTLKAEQSAIRLVRGGSPSGLPTPTTQASADAVVLASVEVGSAAALDVSRPTI